VRASAFYFENGRNNMHITNRLLISAATFCLAAYATLMLYGAHLQAVGVNPFS
jgi:hypothetical protein